MLRSFLDLEQDRVYETVLHFARSSFWRRVGIAFCVLVVMWIGFALGWWLAGLVLMLVGFVAFNIYRDWQGVEQERADIQARKGVGARIEAVVQAMSGGEALSDIAARLTTETQTDISVKIVQDALEVYVRTEEARVAKQAAEAHLRDRVMRVQAREQSELTPVTYAVFRGARVGSGYQLTTPYGVYELEVKDAKTRFVVRALTQDTAVLHTAPWRDTAASAWKDLEERLARHLNVPFEHAPCPLEL